MEQWRNAGLLALLLIGIHLTRADEGDNEKGKCKSGNYTQYLKTNENVKVTFCAGKDDGKICRISLEKEKVNIEYCFIFKDKENKTQQCLTSNPDTKVTGEVKEDKYCTITIPKMSSDLNGEWKLIMGQQTAKFDLKLEEKSQITITLPDTVILNKTVDVTCKVSGGVPSTKASDIALMLMDSENKTVGERFSKNSTDRTETGEDVQATKTFTPKLEDQGLRPRCKVVQKDGEFSLTSDKIAEPLDVKFGPTISSEPNYKKDNIVVITIESNPAPSSWNLTATTVCHGNNSNCTELNLDGESEKNDHISVQINKVEHSFKHELTINALKAEHLVNSTVSLTISNGISESLEIKAFPLLSTKNSSTTSKPGDRPDNSTSKPIKSTTEAEEGDTGDQKGGLSGGAVAAIVIFVILGVVAGVYFYRKRNGSGSERMPLSGTSMSSLSSR